jgi:hypothetical protein
VEEGRHRDDEMHDLAVGSAALDFERGGSNEVSWDVGTCHYWPIYTLGTPTLLETYIGHLLISIFSA